MTESRSLNLPPFFLIGVFGHRQRRERAGSFGELLKVVSVYIENVLSVLNIKD